MFERYVGILICWKLDGWRNNPTLSCIVGIVVVSRSLPTIIVCVSPNEVQSIWLVHILNGETTVSSEESAFEDRAFAWWGIATTFCSTLLEGKVTYFPSGCFCSATGIIESYHYIGTTQQFLRNIDRSCIPCVVVWSFLELEVESRPSGSRWSTIGVVGTNLHLLLRGCAFVAEYVFE